MGQVMKMSGQWSVVSGGEHGGDADATGRGRRGTLKRELRRGFSLVEVLLAIFILGIGLIMVASVFPVGANWTRQVAEESVGQQVAQNAKTVLERHYGVNGDLRGYLAPDFIVGPGVANGNNRNSILRSTVTPAGPFGLQALPGFLPDVGTGLPGIPPSERAYQFGATNPFPAQDWTKCTYFWSAVARLDPVHRAPLGVPGTFPVDPTNGILLSSSYTYDVYILVFRKGSLEHRFTNPSANPPPGSEISGLRDASWGANATLVPSVYGATYAPGSANSNGLVSNALPAMGSYGIGAWSGTVFHQVVNTSASPAQAMPRPMLLGQPANAAPQEPVIYAPAADGNDSSASPLIFVYQTTLTF